MIMASAVLLGAATVLLMVEESKRRPSGEVVYASYPRDGRAA